jgi:predicted N-acyltransferase
VHVLFPPEEEARLWEAQGYLMRLGFQFHWRNQGYASMADFLARFNAKKRHQLKREMAQPAKDGLVLETLAPEALDAKAVATAFELYASTVDKYFYGRRYLNPKFFALVAERYRHRLAWVVAKQNDRVVAGAFNVKKGDRLYGRYWGTKVDLPFLHFNVCYYHGIRQCIDEGLQVFEPGAGGEHKYVRGFLPTLTYSAHHLENPRLRAIIADFVQREAQAVRAHVARERDGGPLKPGDEAVQASDEEGESPLRRHLVTKS